MKEILMPKEQEPKIITAKAPHRISLWGGGTDVAPFCNEYGGMVINLAINLYSGASIDREQLTSNFYQGELVEAILKRYDLPKDFNINYMAGGGSGLGGSASLSVAVIGAVRQYLGLRVDKDEIARQAFEVETVDLGWHGGCQDQYACAYGGFNFMEIGGMVNVKPLDNLHKIFPYMVLFDTGVKRESFKIQEGFKSPTREQTRALMILKGLCLSAKEAITSDKKHLIPLLGDLLHKTWLVKKASNDVSNAEIDKIYSVGINCGAMGGKILGAGQGGHILFMCKQSKQNQLVRTMIDLGLTYVKFEPDYNGLEVV